jgi:hypothetical protein
MVLEDLFKAFFCNPIIGSTWLLFDFESHSFGLIWKTFLYYTHMVLIIIRI